MWGFFLGSFKIAYLAVKLLGCKKGQDLLLRDIIIFILHYAIFILYNKFNPNPMQTIKVTTADKGEYHWESYLLANQLRRLNLLLIQLEIDPWTKRKVHFILKQKVTRDNIIPLSAHPINIFLHHLIHDTLDELMDNTILIRNQ